MLDGDLHYLQHKLEENQQHGPDRFYRDFLCPLFFEGFARREQDRSPEARQMLGRIPFLNGGLFLRHEIEQRYGKRIQIPDAAFERLFTFFERYQWHLDDRPLRADNEINPGVLGYIFEKYINQKQMGAYYTEEDITDYISKNTILPFLFDQVRRAYPAAFKGPALSLSKGEDVVWSLLWDDPDRYIYPAVRHGAQLDLPPEIAVGLDDVAQRGAWNTPAAEGYALPTEIWRETVARRQHYERVRSRLAGGEVCEINDLVTLNLDIRQFAQDVIGNCTDPAFLRAFWRAVNEVTVLDPTVGSGAFLFAALNILEPLYEACLDRMAIFVAELPPGSRKLPDFRRELDRVAQHPGQRYFVLKSIIINNLYGVDIMDEAVEIAKLRLFLKLVAEVGRVDEVEPLPDIDFNVRAGNTLVGFATYAEVERAVYQEGAQIRLMLDENPMVAIEEKAQDVDRLYQHFRRQQTELGGEVTPEDKQALRERLDTLANELDHYLAKEYGVDPDLPMDFHLWRESHKPFHWFVEFYGILKQSGFDVIIGNPPWKEYSSVRGTYTVRNYETERSGNLYAICTERALNLRSDRGWMSFIVQLPLISSSRMSAVRELLRQQSSSLLVAPFDDRPGKLFRGLQHCRSVIFISQGYKDGEPVSRATTRYQRWFTHTRDNLFAKLEYVKVTGAVVYPNLFPKYANSLEARVFERVKSQGKQLLGVYFNRRKMEHFIFYQEAMQYWAKATVGLPYYAKNGVVGAPAHGRFLYFNDENHAHTACVLLNSNLFYIYFIAYGDGFHLNQRLVAGFPLVPGVLEDSHLVALSKQLMAELKANAERRVIRTRNGYEIAYDEYYVGKSKLTIDEIDHILAQHYGFTDEELDFIINYDIKYRMGDALFESEM